MLERDKHREWKNSELGIQKEAGKAQALFPKQAGAWSSSPGIFHKTSPEAALLGRGPGSGVILGRAPSRK